MKKVLILCLALVLAVGTAVTGTVAYLQETDSDVNVAVVGNVDIEQHEMQRKEGVAFNAALKEGDLVPYVQGQNLFPAYPTVEMSENPYTAEESDLLVWGPYVTADSDESKGTAAANGLWNEDKLKGAMDKMVFVENTGTADCYYRTWFAFECPKGMAYSTGSDKEFMMNVNLNKRFTWEEYKGEGAEDGYVEIGGVRYLVYCATYNQALEPGTISRPSLLQVVMTHHADNDDVKKLGDTYEILVFSQAMQTVNFEEVGATVALNTAFGTDHPWKETAKTVNDSDEMKAALSQPGKTLIITLNSDVTVDANAWDMAAMGSDNVETIIIDGQGKYTLDFKHGNSDWNNVAVKNNGKLVLKNLHITNSGYNNGPWNRHDLNFGCEVDMINVTSDKAFAFKSGATLQNVKISDANTSDTYAIWIQPNGQTVTLKNVTIDMLDCTDGRGIKIDEQYVSAPAKVTLNVADTTFKTEEKSAILVKSVAGADINLSNIDISKVVADTTNAVWVDEASAGYADLVTVTGGTKIVEPSNP